MKPSAVVMVNGQRSICIHALMGGEKPYNKLHPEWDRKVPTKWTGSGWHLMVKLYLGTSHVLGKYTLEHSHPIGMANVRFMQLLEATKDQI